MDTAFAKSPHIDKYCTFAELQKKEAENYLVTVSDAPKDREHVSVLAIHGGTIEVMTSEIAFAIARQLGRYYAFMGKLDETEAFTRLHITSKNFDEPRCLAMVSDSLYVLSIHGCPNMHSHDSTVYLGGLDDELIMRTRNVLQNFGFTCLEHPKYKGIHKQNICNKNPRGMGLQIELPYHFRLQENCRTKFISAMRKVIQKINHKKDLSCDEVFFQL